MRIINVQAAQAQHAGGADAALLVHLEGVVDQGLDVGVAALGPAVDALVDQLLGRLQALVKDDALLHLPDDLVAAIKAHQRHVALHAAILDVVVGQAAVHKVLHGLHARQLKGQQVGAGLLGGGAQIRHDLGAVFVHRLDQGIGHQRAVGGLPIALGHCVLI